MPTFDPSSFGLPSYGAEGPNTASIFWVLALLFDLVFVVVVVKEALERDANALGWGIATFFLPLIGYAIWKASVSREDNTPDMSIIHRERRRPRVAMPDPPAAATPTSPRRRPRNFF